MFRLFDEVTLYFKKLVRNLIFLCLKMERFSANRCVFYEFEFDMAWFDSCEYRRGWMNLKMCQLVYISHLSEEQFDVVK